MEAQEELGHRLFRMRLVSSTQSVAIAVLGTAVAVAAGNATDSERAETVAAAAALETPADSERAGSQRRQD